jgi:hypothetical protein
MIPIFYTMMGGRRTFVGRTGRGCDCNETAAIGAWQSVDHGWGSAVHQGQVFHSSLIPVIRTQVCWALPRTRPVIILIRVQREASIVGTSNRTETTVAWWGVGERGGHTVHRRQVVHSSLVPVTRTQVCWALPRTRPVIILIRVQREASIVGTGNKTVTTG